MLSLFDLVLGTICQALEKYNIEKDIASYIKKEFDKKYNPTWHCIVGRNFGEFCPHFTLYGRTGVVLYE